MIKGSAYEGLEENNYYGVLLDIIELDFLGDMTRVVMFKCDWYDIHKGMKIDRSKNVSINIHTKLRAYEPFVLSQQAEQVFYAPNVSQKNKDWQTVIRTKARDRFDIPEEEGDTYQDDFNEFPLNLLDDNNIDNVSLNVDGSFDVVSFAPDPTLHEESESYVEDETENFNSEDECSI